jgi:hypothetical protein
LYGEKNKRGRPREREGEEQTTETTPVLPTPDHIEERIILYQGRDEVNKVLKNHGGVGRNEGGTIFRGREDHSESDTGGPSDGTCPVAERRERGLPDRRPDRLGEESDDPDILYPDDPPIGEPVGSGTGPLDGRAAKRGRSKGKSKAKGQKKVLHAIACTVSLDEFLWLRTHLSQKRGSMARFLSGLVKDYLRKYEDAPKVPRHPSVSGQGHQDSHGNEERYGHTDAGH